MKPLLKLISLAAMLSSSSAFAHDVPLSAGTYTNVEEVYFDGNANRKVAPSIFLTVESSSAGPTVQTVDAFGHSVDQDIDEDKLYQQSPDRIIYTLAEGRTTELRRARSISCWVAIRKDQPKADGSEDWYFKAGVKLHDQGGQALVGGGESGAQPVLVRVRNVTWDKGSTNQPVVSLYIHKADDPVRAVSYSWAAPDSARVGINLRWVQTGCSVDASGEKSVLNSEKFGG